MAKSKKSAKKTGKKVKTDLAEEAKKEAKEKIGKKIKNLEDASEDIDEDPGEIKEDSLKNNAKESIDTQPEGMEFVQELKIPMDRIAVLIGKEGKIKREIEEFTHCRLSVDSEEGNVMIKGADTIGMLSAREIIKAISRGFNPDTAMLLLKNDYVLEIVSIQDYAGKAKNRIARLKGRVIGSEGRSRRTIEALTETNICVYGKTVAILGYPENVSTARRAIESLFAGSEHATVYKWLERKRREAKMSEISANQIENIKRIDSEDESN